MQGDLIPQLCFPVASVHGPFKTILLLTLTVYLVTLQGLYQA